MLAGQTFKIDLENIFLDYAPEDAEEAQLAPKGTYIERYTVKGEEFFDLYQRTDGAGSELVAMHGEMCKICEVRDDGAVILVNLDGEDPDKRFMLMNYDAMLACDETVTGSGSDTYDGAWR